MTVAVVVNTCALGEGASQVESSGGIVHAERVALLRDQLLPRLLNDPDVSEVVVAGEWEPGEGYTYVPSESQAFDCTDALRQRQLGYDATSSDLILFLHDDHLPGAEFFATLKTKYATQKWDVLVPRRFAVELTPDAPATGHLLNNGKEYGYVMGHACVMHRGICEQVRWMDVPRAFIWDTLHTAILREHHARIRWVDDLVVYDLEAQLGARPWL